MKKTQKQPQILIKNNISIKLKEKTSFHSLIF